MYLESFWHTVAGYEAQQCLGTAEQPLRGPRAGSRAAVPSERSEMNEWKSQKTQITWLCGGAET